MLNRTERENVFRRRLSAVSAGGTYDDLKFGPVKSGELYKIEQISVENETTAFTKIRVFTNGHGYSHYRFEQASPAATTLYWSEEDIYLGEGDILVVRCTGCTNGDKLAAYLDGKYIVKDKKVT